MSEDLPPELTTGERIRILRERRGLTRKVLAGLVGRSEDWLKKIENGDRELRSITHFVRLAHALHVSNVATLTGDALSIPTNPVGKLSHGSVPTIRAAMHSVSFGGTPTIGAVSPDALRGRVDGAWKLWHSSAHQRTEVGALLPDLLRDAHACVRTSRGNDRRAAHAATADLYRLVQRMLAHISEPELYWLAVDRGRAHSEEADNPVSLALAAWSMAIGQRAAGYPEEAVHTDEAGMDLLRDQMDEGEAETLAVYGALNLQAATSCGLDGRGGDAGRYLDEAGRVADRLPAGYTHLMSAFDASNVRIHSVSVGVGLMTPGEALRSAESIAPETIPSLERRSRLFLDIAAGYRQRNEEAAAVHYLSAAHRTSPEAVRYVPMARSVARDLALSATGPLKADAVALADEIGVRAA
ncbi:helix-turn-helix transcriptional regulator [Nocardiopsis sp. B62]|uniref:helix-turn-helix domain-containing protein n=1 Tax=Nocardiopsis sp. B62 TaxID=2824874 RepID=UPI001B35FE67|nr:helix-turn-helix transcriptional regulator [Nocardiopsis sp. B62]MBQ1081561.1 helix-turn-helix domain-containing protein [Nocardiopsis sp. B62]